MKKTYPKRKVPGSLKKATRTRVKTKPNTIPVSKLKKQLEALQKLVVIKLYGTDCFTCEASQCEGKNRHLGHVPWPRTDLSLQSKFDYRYTRVQCMVCNIHRGGAGAKAYARMLAEGIDMNILREYADAGKGKPVPRAWFIEKANEYIAILAEE